MKKLKKNDSANKNKKEEKQKKKTTNRLKQIKWTNSLKEKKTYAILFTKTPPKVIET